jgi:signal peptidase I
MGNEAMDFSLIMFLLLCVTGLVWGMDRWLWARRRRRATESLIRTGGAEPMRKEPVYVEYARAFFPVILVVFLLRSFIVEPFRIPSGSMLPSLLIGDFILVNKFTYGLRLPILNAKMVNINLPRRGEVAVFRFPRDTSINYIKRIVGVPGDRILYKDKKLYINGTQMEQTSVHHGERPQSGDQFGNVARFTEDLAGARHDILVMDRPEHPPVEFVVPSDHYFVMGDNRDQSNDSRYWGFVPEKNLVGKAFLIWFSWDLMGQDLWFWQRVVWNRIGTSIH